VAHEFLFAVELMVNKYSSVAAAIVLNHLSRDDKKVKLKKNPQKVAFPISA
jgi:hypothetical protein